MPSFKYLNGTNTIGTGTYKFKHINYEAPTLNAPTISLSGSVISWSAITNATTYSILEGGVEFTTTSDTSFDLSTIIGTDGTYDISLIAKATGYRDSNVSNVVQYIKESAKNYITFSSPYSFTLNKDSNATNDGIVQYSTDATTWNTFTTTSVSAVLAASGLYEIYMRGTGNTFVQGNTSQSSPYFKMSGTSISCDGNIENLLDYATVANGNHPTMGSYYFMFYGCTSLTSCPTLPATTLAAYCYYYMFSGCTSLKLSTVATGTYTVPFRVPTSGTGTADSGSLTDMFSTTGGTFTGTPDINTTYYLSV